MNHFFTGQKSCQPFYALSFSQKSIRIILCAFLLMISYTGFSASPADFHPTDNEMPAPGNWSIPIDVALPYSPGLTLSVKEMYKSQPGFAGFSSQAAYNPDTGSIKFSLSGPASTMPPAVALVVITIVDPVSNAEENYLISSDGGGIMLILDEF